jgi:hypothetical protein
MAVARVRRLRDYNSSTKVVAAGANIVTFNPGDMPSAGVTKYFLTLTGVGNTLNAIDRIRVKANGVAFYDFTVAQYRALVYWMTKGRVCYPADGVISALGAAGTAVNWRRLTIPFGLVHEIDKSLRDRCQFPVGSGATVEVVFNANAVSGTVTIGWEETNVPAAAFPRFYGSQMNIGASQSNGKYPFSEDGEILGVTMEQTGLLRARIVLNGLQVVHLRGQPASSATVTEDSMIFESELLENGTTPNLTAGTAAVDNSPDDTRFLSIDAGENASQRSFIELETGAAWSGVASELGVYSVVEYGAR